MDLSVSFPAHIKPGPLPTSSGSLFDFVFSNPFAKGSEVVKHGPKQQADHVLYAPTLEP